MCDPFMLAGTVGLGAAGSIINGNSAKEAAARDAAARNAVLAQTIGKENGYAADNATQLNGNIAHYAPGSQDAQLKAAQGARTANMTGNITSADPHAVPLPADSNPAVSSDLAKRMLAVHDGAVERAGLTAKVGGYGDTWLQNNLNTNEADRNFRDTVNSFRRLTLSEVQDARPLRIKVINVQPGDTVESLAHRMAGVDHQAERFRVINGLDAKDTIKARDRVKIVVD